VKRRKILEKFEKIERKIYYEPPVYVTSFVTPRTRNHVKQPKVSSTAYSVYEPLTFHEVPGDVVYVSRTQKK